MSGGLPPHLDLVYGDIWSSLYQFNPLMPIGCRTPPTSPKPSGRRIRSGCSMRLTITLLLVTMSCATCLRTSPVRMGLASSASKLMGRLRAKREVKDVSPLIQPGDKLPSVEVMSAEGRPASLSQVVGSSSGYSLLVGMPGAFTPTCSTCHLPSLVEAAPKFKELGVKKIAVMTTNDRYVNEAWRKNIEKTMQAKVTLTMLSDADGAALRALGLVDDLGFGMGERSNRFALLAGPWLRVEPMTRGDN